MPAAIFRALVGALALLLCATAHADKLQELTRSLMQDPSYKVRVQAAIVLGKLKDRRATAALIQALRDENDSVRAVAATSLGSIGDKTAADALMMAASGDASEFVRNQAGKALALLGSPAAAIAASPKAGAKFYVAVEFSAKGTGGATYSEVVRQALFRELQKLPFVTLAVAGAPTKAFLAAHRLRGFVVDGMVQRLSATRSGGGQQIDCDLKAFVATFPERSIKMMTQEGASLQTVASPAEELAGKRDCLAAAVEAVRDDVDKFLRTQQ